MNLVSAFNFTSLYTSWPIIPKQPMCSFKGPYVICGFAWGLKGPSHAQDEAQMIVVVKVTRRC